MDPNSPTGRKTEAVCRPYRDLRSGAAAWSRVSGTRTAVDSRRHGSGRQLSSCVPSAINQGVQREAWRGCGRGGRVRVVAGRGRELGGADESRGVRVIARGARNSCSPRQVGEDGAREIEEINKSTNRQITQTAESPHRHHDAPEQYDEHGCREGEERPVPLRRVLADRHDHSHHRRAHEDDQAGAGERCREESVHAGELEHEAESEERRAGERARPSTPGRACARVGRRTHRSSGSPREHEECDHDEDHREEDLQALGARPCGEREPGPRSGQHAQDRPPRPSTERSRLARSRSPRRRWP